MNVDYADDIALLANTPAQAESLLHSLEWVVGSIGFCVNADKTEYMCFNQRGDISTLNGSSQKLVNKFTYLGSSISSMENNTNTWLVKAWTAIDRLSDKIKCNFFQAAVMSIHSMYAFTTWMLTKHIEKKLDSNSTRMLQVILNKSWKQHPTKQ